VEINQVVIQKGLDNQLVLYWYQDRGRIVTSEYWAKIYLVLVLQRDFCNGRWYTTLQPSRGRRG
jgi:hypothetical protein